MGNQRARTGKAETGWFAFTLLTLCPFTFLLTLYLLTYPFALTIPFTLLPYKLALYPSPFNLPSTLYP